MDKHTTSRMKWLIEEELNQELNTDFSHPSPFPEPSLIISHTALEDFHY